MIEIQLTRYLYVKKEVEIALLLCILDKKEDAIFWAYELYYSGFKKELSMLLFKIYYDFFACLNPKFEKYLLVKLKNNLNDCENNQELISSIIHNFIYRSFTVDVFLLKQMKNLIHFEEKVLMKNNVLIFLKTIMNGSEPILPLFKKIISSFHKKGTITDTQFKNHIKDFEKICKNNNIDKESALLSRYLNLIAIEKGLKMGKNVIITIDPEEVVAYETIGQELKCWKILKSACLCKITEQKYMTSFCLDHRNPWFKDKMYFQWQYWSSYSPLWRERIERFHGMIDHEKKDILFPNDDIFEDYYNQFNLEPDEQSKETQDHFMGEFLIDRSSNDFYNEYNKNMIISIDNSLLENNIKKFIY